MTYTVEVRNLNLPDRKVTYYSSSSSLSLELENYHDQVVHLQRNHYAAFSMEQNDITYLLRTAVRHDVSDYLEKENGSI